MVRGTTNSFNVYGIIAAFPETSTGIFAVKADSQVTVSWNAVSGATSYNIYWNIAGGVTIFDNKITNVTSPYLHAGLTNETTYSYIVTAVNSVGEGSPSEEVSATPKTFATIPDSPQDIKVIPGDIQVTVSWNIVNEATSYNIYWNTIGGVTTSDNKISNVISPHAHSNLTNGTRYHYVVTAANSAGESTPASTVSAVPMAPIVGELHKLVPTDLSIGGGGDFGNSVAIDGNYAIVGAHGDIDIENSLDLAGAAYIFHRDPTTGQWDSGTKVVAHTREASSFFGQNVAISGDYAIVGAYLESGGGAAYIFKRTGINSWDSGTRITAFDAHGKTTFNSWGDGFGVGVDIEGNYAIIGAYLQFGSGSYPGGAYIFHRDPATDTWDRGTKIVAHDAQREDWFGLSVSIDGEYAIVGAFHEDSSGDNSGAAYIYHRTETNAWDAGFKILAPDAREKDRFGMRVSINDSFATVSARFDNRVSGDDFPVYVFRHSGTNIWSHNLNLVSPNVETEQRFGTSVSISDDLAIVGAPGFPDEAYIYQRDPISDTWNTGTTISISNTFQEFGVSVHVNGTDAIVGASGFAYIFLLTPL